MIEDKTDKRETQNDKNYEPPTIIEKKQIKIELLTNYIPEEPPPPL